MSNHVHIICRTKEGFKLSDIVRDFKKFTSKEIIKIIQTEPESRREWMLVVFGKAGNSNPNNKTFQVWRQDNHPIELYTNSVIDQKMEYIHMNPVKSGIVQNAEDYIYSSARNYAELDSVLEIEKM
jgi:REP element-mobilizing transposase RayT